MKEHILIVDDHPVVLDGIHLFLSKIRPHASFTTVSSGNDALSAFKNNRSINWAFIDINLPDITGLELVGLLMKNEYSGRIVVLSSELDVKTIDQAVKLGINGVLSKAFTKEEFELCMMTIDLGEVFLTEKHAEELHYYRESILLKGAHIEEALSFRQLEVLKLMSDGLSNKEISKLLNIATNTVKSHVSAIMSALKVSNRTQCVLTAQKLNLVKETTDK